MGRIFERIDLRVDPEAPLGPALAHLRSGGVVAYPTETVYGFGATLSDSGIAAMRRLKSRPPDKPFIVLVADAGEVEALAWTEQARELAVSFWPGAVTLVLQDPDAAFPDAVRSPSGAVAVRVSPHPVVRRLLEELGEPITSSSVNEPRQEPVRSGDDLQGVVERLGDADVIVLDAGTLPESGPSTIIDCSGPNPVVLREGTVPVGRLRCVLPEIHGKRA